VSCGFHVVGLPLAQRRERLISQLERRGMAPVRGESELADLARNFGRLLLEAADQVRVLPENTTDAKLREWEWFLHGLGHGYELVRLWLEEGERAP
jgi:hypothetical protein